MGFAAVAILTADAAAMYHPTLGRFMQRDPGPESLAAPVRIGSRRPVATRALRGQDAMHQYADGMNAYGYTRGNPIGMVDPLGLQGLDLRGNPAGYECCCCCVDDLSVTDVATLMYGNLSAAGHSFTVNADLSYKLPDGGGYVKGDCTLRWEERSNIPSTGMSHYMQPRAWVDQMDAVRQGLLPIISETLRPWFFRERPCPGEETVAMKDKPGAQNVPGTLARWLDIKVTISSTQEPKCEGKCSNKSMTVSTRQELEFRGGTVVGGLDLRGDYSGSGSYFGVGPVQAQPW